jgi:hypothetical protein
MSDTNHRLRPVVAITEVDRDYGVYDGRTLKTDRFAIWLEQQGVSWPRLESGIKPKAPVH